jgi:hypothetical protein
VKVLWQKMQEIVSEGFGFGRTTSFIVGDIVGCVFNIILKLLMLVLVSSSVYGGGDSDGWLIGDVDGGCGKIACPSNTVYSTTGVPLDGSNSVFGTSFGSAFGKGIGLDVRLRHCGLIFTGSCTQAYLTMALMAITFL